eukprot:4031238-Amphidinium_carterae.1
MVLPRVQPLPVAARPLVNSHQTVWCIRVVRLLLSISLPPLHELVMRGSLGYARTPGQEILKCFKCQEASRGCYKRTA